MMSGPNFLRLPGWRGQAMSIPRRGDVMAYAAVFPVGSFTFTAAASGVYKFYLWGGGDGGDGTGGGGASGSYAEKTVRLMLGASLSGTVGRGGGSEGAPGNTTLTLVDGSVVVAPAPSGRTTPVAGSGGDINLTGSIPGGTAGTNGGSGQGTGGGAGGLGDGSTAGGGGGAPANLPMRGGKGGNHSGSQRGRTPGGGGCGYPLREGGDGLVIVVRTA